MLDINAWEAVIIAVIAFAVIGPERLPQYAAKLGQWVRQGKAMAENARGQLREQLGPEFDNVDWQAYDPRKYDPRRIVREALTNPDPEDGSGSGSAAANLAGAVGTSARRFDPSLPTPFDDEAT